MYHFYVLVLYELNNFTSIFMPSQVQKLKLDIET